jgi:hypothetical protein
MTGVYFLLNKHKVVYIGATQRWPFRISQHPEILFDEARIIECSKDIMFKNESRLIKLFKPKYNKQQNERVVRSKLKDWVIDNQDELIKSFAKGEQVVMMRKAHRELGYSIKTEAKYIQHAALRALSKVTGRQYSWCKRYKTVKFH